MRIFTIKLKVALPDKKIKTNFPSEAEEIENQIGFQMDDWCQHFLIAKSYHISSICENKIDFPDPKGKRQLETWQEKAEEEMRKSE